jgi:hypothetical protein
MIGPKVADVFVYEQSMMLKNDHVIHCIDFLPTIKLVVVQFVIPWFSNLDQIAINETQYNLKTFEIKYLKQLFPQVLAMQFQLQMHH